MASVFSLGIYFGASFCFITLRFHSSASLGSELSLDVLGSEVNDSGLEDDATGTSGKIKENLSDASIDSQSLKDSAYGEVSEISGSMTTESPSEATTDCESDSVDIAEEENEAEESGLVLPSSYTDAGYVNIDEGDVHHPRESTSLSDIPDNENEQVDLEQMVRLMSVNSYDAEAAIERYFNIDAIACSGVPMLHCVRLMCSFLLAGKPGSLLPDSRTRVSVKSLALGCLSHALDIYPEAFLARVMPEEGADNVKDSHLSEQCVRDCLLFAEHVDQQIRGMVSLVVGNYVNAALCQSGLVELNMV